MAENRPERPGAETGTTPSHDDAGPVVPKARTPDPAPAAERRRPSPRKRAKKAAPAKAAEPEPAAHERAGNERVENERVASEPAKTPAKISAKPSAKKPAKKAAKRAPKKAAEPAERTEPAEPAEPVGAPVPGGPHPAAPGVWTAAVWEAVRSDPEQAPHRLAQLAVAELGPRAAAWVEWLRQTYPGAPADGLVRLAARQAGRAGRAVALTGVGGPFAATLCLPAAGWVRVSVVLRIAAAYGHDPTDPRRAPELIELLGLEPAVSVAAEPAEAEAGGRAGSRIAAYLRRLDLLRPVLITPPLLRRASPGTVLQLLAGVSEHGYSIERLAHRAARFYRPGSQSSTAASARSSSSAYKP